MHAALLRANLETALGKRVTTPFTNLDRGVPETVSSGIPSLDLLTGGFPRGAITEISGPLSSGRTSVMLSLFAGATGRSEAIALVDGRDTFTPQSAAGAGVDLKRLLWVRCNRLDDVLKTADLIFKGGGFGIVAVDVADFPAAGVRGVPITTWFRFQRAIENTPTVLLLVSREPVAQSCAALVLHFNPQQAIWTGEPDPAHSLLLDSNRLNVEIVRSRQSSLSRWARHVCFDLRIRF